MSSSVMSRAGSLGAVPKQPDKWYREPWLLLVFGGPLLVVLACVVTGVLAVRGADPVLAEDYYRQGLHINQQLKAASNAGTAHLQGRVSLILDQIDVQLQGNVNWPETITLGLQPVDGKPLPDVVLHQAGPGVYRGHLPAGVTQGPWQVRLEAGNWRLTGWWAQPRQTLQLKPDAR